MSLLKYIFYTTVFLGIVWPFAIMFKISVFPVISPDRLILLLLLLFFSALLLTRQVKLNFNSHNKFIIITLLFFLWSILSSIIASENLGRSLFASVNWFLIGPILSIIIFTIFKNTYDIIKILQVVVFAMFFVNIIGAIEIMTEMSLFSNLLISVNDDILTSLIDLRRDGMHRVRSVFVSPLVYAQFLALSIPLNMYLMKINDNAIIKVMFVMNILFIFLLSYVTGSRAGLFLAIISILLFYTLKFIITARKSRQIFIITIIILLPLVLFFSWNYFQELIINAHNLDDNYKAGFVGEQEASTLSRIYQIEIGFKLFLESPIFGYGSNQAISMMKLAGHGHLDNYYLGILLDRGLIALLLFLYFILFVINESIKNIIRYKDLLTIALLSSFIITVSYYLILTINKVDSMMFILAALIFVRSNILNTQELNHNKHRQL